MYFFRNKLILETFWCYHVLVRTLVRLGKSVAEAVTYCDKQLVFGGSVENLCCQMCIFLQLWMLCMYLFFWRHNKFIIFHFFFCLLYNFLYKSIYIYLYNIEAPPNCKSRCGVLQCLRGMRKVQDISGSVGGWKSNPVYSYIRWS
jgi:hypothetical protein